MEEFKNFIKAWSFALAILTFCHFVIKQIPKGALRLISLLPIVCIFLYLPLTLSSVHFITIIFFFFSWLGSFKLLLFAFNKGPLGDPSMPLQHFIPLACLPITIKPSEKGPKSSYNYFTRTLVFGLVIKCYEYKPFLHPNVMSFYYCVYLYLAVEVILAITAYPAQAMFGIEIEPQFNDPFLSTSLQDFWGYRWNLMVPVILRPSVYLPVRTLFTTLLGRKPALVIAMLSSFTVSGLMHELLFYYITLVKPTWGVTRFFMLQGMCTGIEVVVKKAVGGKWRLPPLISMGLTVGFMVVTGSCLFFPPIIKNQVDVMTFEDYKALGNLCKNLLRASTTALGI